MTASLYEAPLYDCVAFFRRITDFAGDDYYRWP
jgi:hypothetical protein